MDFVFQMVDSINKALDSIAVRIISLLTKGGEPAEGLFQRKAGRDFLVKVGKEMVEPVHEHEQGFLKVKFFLVRVKLELFQFGFSQTPMEEKKLLESGFEVGGIIFGRGGKINIIKAFQNSMGNISPELVDVGKGGEILDVLVIIAAGALFVGVDRGRRLDSLFGHEVGEKGEVY